MKTAWELTDLYFLNFHLEGGNSFFECPLDVPFCERQSCVQAGFDFSNTESNAFACYSQPGCCFDEKLYAHRVAFGPNFFKRYILFAIH